MNAPDARSLPRYERVRMSHGKPKTTKSSHTHGGHSQARAGYSLNDTHDPRIGASGEATKLLPGRYKAPLPRNVIRYHKPTSPIPTPEVHP